MKLKFFSIVAAVMLLSGCKSAITLTVVNDYNIVRDSEMIEVDTQSITSRFGAIFVITDNAGNEVPYQITHDGKLIFQTTLPEFTKRQYKICKGVPTPVDTTCTAFFRPDCQDDVAWENDHGGYRLYGPQYKHGGGKVYGYDIWCKSVTKPVVSKFYDNHHHNLSYHIDHGEGFDGYTVGPTLGAGMSALLDSHKNIYYPCAYNKYEILDNGPLRTTIKFVIDPFVIDGDTVTETRIITLDKGAWLNRATVSFANLSTEKSIVSGIVIHNDNTDYILDRDNALMAYADLSDNLSAGNGEIYVGVIGEKCDSMVFRHINPSVANACGQILLYNTYNPDTRLRYYWGSAWSKGGVKSREDWLEIMRDTAAKLRSPLTVKLK